jgi:IclR family acetate operon transcriptional repressor
MPRPRTDTSAEPPKLLEKTLRVLAAFDDRSPVWSEARLRRELSMPSTTLNRILRGLEAAGYLLRYDDGRYQLGVAAIRLGNRASRALDLATALDAQLRALAHETGEMVMLAVPDVPAGIARYVQTIESSSRLRVSAEVGMEVPLTAGATAKAVFAFLPADRIERVLSQELRPLASGTITDPVVLREQVRQIRERGWAFSWQETYEGAWAVAAPLIDVDQGSAYAAVGVAVPVSRHSIQTEHAVRDAVLRTVGEASRALG